LSSGSHNASVFRANERGIALILVLWVMALISILAIGFAGSARTELQISRNQYETARARTAADSAVSLAVLAVLDPSPQSQWSADGQAHTLNLDGTTVRVEVQDEGGKVDLNMAPNELLMGLFEGLGIEPGRSAALADAIAQWKRQRQRELDAQDSRRASAQPQPAFTDITELRLVPGITHSLYDRITPLVTIYSRNVRIDPLTAPPEVLYGIPDLARQDAEAFLDARAESSASQAGLALMHTGSVSRFLGHRPLRTATFRAEATTANGARFVRTAIILLTSARSGRPYQVLAWGEGRSRETEAPLAIQ
jgi:general secretion pathway protein K